MEENETVLEYNGITGETTIRPQTPEELAEREQMQAAQEALQAEQDAKVAARQSALAKLAALGLTEEEIGAL
jgi:DNA-binding NarL/FixJ family response regulator